MSDWLDDAPRGVSPSGVAAIASWRRAAMRCLGVAAYCVSWAGRSLWAIGFHIVMNVGALVGIGVVIGVVAVVIMVLAGVASVLSVFKLGIVAAGFFNFVTDGR